MFTPVHITLRHLQKHLEAPCERYEHFLIMGHFNADPSDPSMTLFCTLFKDALLGLRQVLAI